MSTPFVRSLVWHKMRGCLESVYADPPAHGGFSYSNLPSDFTLSNNGATLSGTPSNSDPAIPSVTSIYNNSGDTTLAYVVEFTITGNTSIGLLGNGNTGVIYGGNSFYSNTVGGTFINLQSPNSGDIIAFVQTRTSTTLFRNGGKLGTISTSPTSIFFYANAAGGAVNSFTVKVETILAFMAYDYSGLANVSLTDWPIAPAGEPLATALSITPSSRTNVTTGMAVSYSVVANGRLASNLVVALASSVGGDTFSPTSVTLTDSARSASFNVTPSAAGSRTITVSASGVSSATATLGAIPAATSLGFDPQYQSGGTLSNNNRTLTSASSSGSGAAALGTATVRQGDNTAGYGYAIEFSIDSFSYSNGSGKLEVKLGDTSLDVDYGFNNGITYSNYDSNSNTSVWVSGDKIGVVVYDLFDNGNGSGSFRVAFFRNGTFISSVMASYLTTGFAILGKTGTNTPNAVTLNNNIATMTYGATYKAYRDSASVQTMTDARGWPDVSVPEKLATTITLSGPTSGTTGTPNAFQAAANGRIASSITVTPSASPSGDTTSGAFALTDSARSVSFSVTPAADGTHSVSITNNGGLTNSGSPATYTSSTPPPTTTLTSGVAANWAASANDGPTFKIAVPNGASNILVSVTGTGSSYYLLYKANTAASATSGGFDGYVASPGSGNITSPAAGFMYFDFYYASGQSGMITATVS